MDSNSWSSCLVIPRFEWRNALSKREISRALVLKKYNNVPFDKAFGSIIAERIVDMVILLGLIIVAFFVQYDVLKTFVLDKLGIFSDDA